MRHRKGFKQLSRKTGHRKAMLANMAASLIKHKRITTTTTKAKALRGYVEPLITNSKEDTTHSRRVVFSYLQDKDAVSELFRDVSPKIMDRPGGYTRILKLDNRLGDNAEMAMIELVDFNETLLSESSSKTATSRRRRRGGAKKKDEEITATSVVAGKMTGAAESAEVSDEVISAQPEGMVETQEEVFTEVSDNEVDEVDEAAEVTEVQAEGSGNEEPQQSDDDSEEKKDS